VVLVLNQCDLRSREDVEEVTEYVRAHARAVLGTEADLKVGSVPFYITGAGLIRFFRTSSHSPTSLIFLCSQRAFLWLWDSLAWRYPSIPRSPPFFPSHFCPSSPPRLFFARRSFLSPQSSPSRRRWSQSLILRRWVPGRWPGKRAILQLCNNI